MKKFSIVVPVYYNELNLPDTVPQLLALGEKLPQWELELVFVDDGSGDRSLQILLDFQKQFPLQIRVVKLSRNFGSMAAIQAGYAVATGDCVGMIAADLQDPPELFLQMIDHWERGRKAVFAVRSDRQESLTQKFFSNTYYALIKRYAIPGYPGGGFDFLLIDRQIVEEVNRIGEKNTNIMSLIFWLGHDHVLIPYVRKKRDKGTSRWTLAKKVKLFIDSFVAFSYLPIRFLSTVGFIVAASSFIYGGFVFYAWAAHKIEVKGWSTLILLLAFTAGVQMMMLGILGEYLWRTLDETRKRPLYVIDTIFDTR
ncbi:glycosyltransferase family 2 protein [Geotalea sp. SG265]|uniref:glycosyltransferase family 2 protein n=1 Tax=Geotalea sp. SG265 TaxID=2922867 RepID=UPI001FAFE7DB